MKPIAEEGIQLEEEEGVVFGCSEEGCIKVYQSHSSFQWAETCKTISGSYMEAAYTPTSRSASVSHSQSEEAPPTADIGWALKNTKKSVHFTTKVRQCLREVFVQEEGIENKARAEDIAARMRSMRTAE